MIFDRKNNEARFVGDVKTIDFSPDRNSFFRSYELQEKENGKSDVGGEESR